MNTLRAVIIGSLTCAAAYALTTPHHANAQERREVQLIPQEADHLTLPAFTQPRREVTLSAHFDSKVLAVHVAEGRFVRMNEAIVQLDDRVAQATLALAREQASQTADVDAAVAQLTREQQVLSRMQEAFAAGAANQDEQDAAAYRVKQAKALLTAAQERRTEAKLRLAEAEAIVERHVIRAPFDGRITAVNTEVGQVVSVGNEMLHIAQTEHMEVELRLPSTQALSLHIGDTYALKLASPMNEVRAATLRYREPSIEVTSNTIRAVFDFLPSSASIIAGVPVSVAKTLPSAELEQDLLQHDISQDTDPINTAQTQSTHASAAENVIQ